MEWAVHLDGAVVTERDLADLPTAARHRTHLRDERAMYRTAIYRTAVYAVSLAQDLKRAHPDDLITIVLWADDDERPPVVEPPGATAVTRRG